MSPKAADALAADFTNTFGGMIPKEAMSNAARVSLNLALFSRTFRLTNLAIYGHAFGHLSKVTIGRIEKYAEDAEKEIGIASKEAQRSMLATILKDLLFFYGLNSIIQNALELASGKSKDDLIRDYARRLLALKMQVQDKPWELVNWLVNPWLPLEKLSATVEHEPGKERRVLLGTEDREGRPKEMQRGIYGKIAAGKTAEDIIMAGTVKGFPKSQIEMMKNIESPLLSALRVIGENDRGFQQKVWDDKAEGIWGAAKNLGKIAAEFLRRQTGLDFYESVYEVGKSAVKGEEIQAIDAAKTVGPLLGVSVSRGHPGGPAAGFAAERKQEQTVIKKEHRAEAARQQEIERRAATAHRDVAPSGSALGQ